MGCARMRWDWACQRGRSPRRGAAPSRPSQAVMRGTATGYVVAGRAASSSARWETMMMMKACQAARAASARPRPRPQWRDFQPRSRLGAALALTHEGFPAPVLSIHPCSRACAPRRAGVLSLLTLLFDQIVQVWWQFRRNLARRTSNNQGHLQITPGATSCTPLPVLRSEN